MDPPRGLALTRPQTEEKTLAIRTLVRPKGPSFHKLQTPFHERAIGPRDPLLSSQIPLNHQSFPTP